MHGPYWIAYGERASAGEAELARVQAERAEDDDPVATILIYSAARDAIAVELGTMDAEFLADIWSVLTETQRRDYQRVEMHRTRQRALSRHLDHFFQNTGRDYIDATEIFAPLLFGPEATHALIAQAERVQTALILELRAAQDRSVVRRFKRWEAAGRPQGEEWLEILRSVSMPLIEIARRLDRTLLETLSTTRAACGDDLDEHDLVVGACYPEAKPVIAAVGTLRRATRELSDGDRAVVGDTLESARIELEALRDSLVAAVDRRYERSFTRPPDFVEVQRALHRSRLAARDRALEIMRELEAALPRPELWAAAGSDRVRPAPRNRPRTVGLDLLFDWAGVAQTSGLQPWQDAYAQAETIAELDTADESFIEALAGSIEEDRLAWVMASARRAWFMQRSPVGGAPMVDIPVLALTVAGDENVRASVARRAGAYYDSVNLHLRERWERPNPGNHAEVYRDIDTALLEVAWSHREIIVAQLPAACHGAFDTVLSEVAHPHMLHGVKTFDEMRSLYLDRIESAPETTARTARIVMLDGLERTNAIVSRLVVALRDVIAWVRHSDGAIVPIPLRLEDTRDLQAEVGALRREYEQIVAATALELDQVLASSDGP